MSDKEVGELWKWYALSTATGTVAEAMRNLIRKLVEERAWKNAAQYYKTLDIAVDEMQSCIISALRDFGIDPKEYNG